MIIMRSYQIISVCFLLLSSFTFANKSRGQSADLLQQINFFSTFEANQNLDKIRLYTYKPSQRTNHVIALLDNLSNLRDKCVVGYVTSNRLINKLNYYKKTAYAQEVINIKKMFKKLEYNLAVIDYYATFLIKNPTRNAKKYIGIMQKKMRECQQIQKQLQSKSGMIAEIREWENKYSSTMGNLH